MDIDAVIRDAEASRNRALEHAELMARAIEAIRQLQAELREAQAGGR